MSASNSISGCCVFCNNTKIHRAVKISHSCPEIDWNWVEMCPEHELLWMTWGVRTFCFNFPKMERILEEKGWIKTHANLIHPPTEK